MLNLAVSVALLVITWLALSLAFGSWIAGVIPGIAVGGLAYFLFARRTGKQVQAGIERIVPLLQQRQIAQAQEVLRELKARHGKWQFLLAGQLDAQLGMIEYMQLEFAKALPLLEKGKWRNWSALVCIGAIHWREGRKDETFTHLGKAQSAAPKEAMPYVVEAMLRVKNQERDHALVALDRGLKVLPDSELLKMVHGRVANKKKIDVNQLPQTWYQFFPEDMLRQQRRQMARVGPQPGPGFRGPAVSRRDRRGR